VKMIPVRFLSEFVPFNAISCQPLLSSRILQPFGTAVSSLSHNRLGNPLNPISNPGTSTIFVACCAAS
jgi:hypothetical protein